MHNSGTVVVIIVGILSHLAQNSRYYLCEDGAVQSAAEEARMPGHAPHEVAVAVVHLAPVGPRVRK